MLDKINESAHVSTDKRSILYDLIENKMKVYLLPNDKLNSVVNYIANRDILYCHNIFRPFSHFSQIADK